MIDSRHAASAPQLHRDFDALKVDLTTQRVAATVADDGGDAEPGERLWHSFVRSDYQRGTFTICRKDGTPVRVFYYAYKGIAHGAHLSFLLPADADAADV